MTKLYSSGFVYNLARDKQSVGGVLKYSLVEVRYEINTVLKSLKMLVTGKVSANEVSGPVGILMLLEILTTRLSQKALWLLCSQ